MVRSAFRLVHHRLSKREVQCQRAAILYVVDEVYCIGWLVEVCAFIQLLMFCCPPVAIQAGLARSGAAPPALLRDMCRNVCRLLPEDFVGRREKEGLSIMSINLMRRCVICALNSLVRMHQQKQRDEHDVVLEP